MHKIIYFMILLFLYSFHTLYAKEYTLQDILILADGPTWILRIR
jgi:hypothetical protein